VHRRRNKALRFKNIFPPGIPETIKDEVNPPFVPLIFDLMWDEWRIHLVFDCLRNAWWENIFESQGFVPPSMDPIDRMELHELQDYYSHLLQLKNPAFNSELKKVEAALAKAQTV
ncbi:MAG: hypothetical protein AAF570_22310, partial [Bacteroidota bacterium]